MCVLERPKSQREIIWLIITSPIFSFLNQTSQSQDIARNEKWYFIEIMDHKNGNPLRESFSPALIYNSIFLVRSDSSARQPQPLKVAGNSTSGVWGVQTSEWFWHHCWWATITKPSSWKLVLNFFVSKTICKLSISRDLWKNYNYI